MRDSRNARGPADFSGAARKPCRSRDHLDRDRYLRFHSMSPALDPFMFLDALLELDDPPAELRDWLGRLDCSADLGAAMLGEPSCLGTARTAIARATWLTWPDSEQIPSCARAALDVLGVCVRW